MWAHCRFWVEPHHSHLPSSLTHWENRESAFRFKEPTALPRAIFRLAHSATLGVFRMKHMGFLSFPVIKVATVFTQPVLDAHDFPVAAGAVVGG